MKIYQKKKKKSNQIYYTESNDDYDDLMQQDIVHLIMVKDNTEAGYYYNESTINYIKNQIYGIKKFPIEEKVKEFLFQI